METKKFEKRFALNKETIADLNRDEMVVVRGGEDTCGYTCPCVWTKGNIMPPKESQGGTCIEPPDTGI
jgi:natural product precursor